MPKNKRLIAIALLWLVTAVILAGGYGCSPREKPRGSGEPTEAPAFAPISLRDSAGREVILEKPVRRIVSMAPSNTEILFALGLGDLVVGVDTYSDYPPETAAVEKIGSFAKPSVEKVVALQPDLVLATGMHENILGQLENLGLRVLVISPRTVDETLTAILLVGTATGRQKAAQELSRQVRSRIDAVVEAIRDIPQEERVRAYYEVYSDPLMTVGPRTLIHELLTLAGGRNIMADAVTDYPRISPEVVVERDPEVIVFPYYHGTGQLTVEQLRARPGWAGVAAVRTGRLFGIDASIISRAGPRIAEAVEELARFFYPGRFAP